MNEGTVPPFTGMVGTKSRENSRGFFAYDKKRKISDRIADV